LNHITGFTEASAPKLAENVREKSEIVNAVLILLSKTFFEFELFNFQVETTLSFLHVYRSVIEQENTRLDDTEDPLLVIYLRLF
jgi:hypothetical protein